MCLLDTSNDSAREAAAGMLHLNLIYTRCYIVPQRYTICPLAVSIISEVDIFYNNSQRGWKYKMPTLQFILIIMWATAAFIIRIAQHRITNQYSFSVYLNSENDAIGATSCCNWHCIWLSLMLITRSNAFSLWHVCYWSEVKLNLGLPDWSMYILSCRRRAHRLVNLEETMSPAI